MREINEAGLNLIKEFESLELEAYKDPVGVWTIGYGHTGPDVKPGMEVSEAQAIDFLREDLAEAQTSVDNLVAIELTDNEFSALVSLVFNIGHGAFETSTCRERLNGNKPDKVGAAEALTWFNKGTIDGNKVVLPGLVRRRLAEQKLFLADMKKMNAASKPKTTFQKATAATKAVAMAPVNGAVAVAKAVTPSKGFRTVTFNTIMMGIVQVLVYLDNNVVKEDVAPGLAMALEATMIFIAVVWGSGNIGLRAVTNTPIGKSEND